MKIVAGNWKMNSNSQEAKILIQSIVEKCSGIVLAQTIVCPPFVYLSHVRSILDESNSLVLIGAQDCSYEESGAFTGEVSALQLRDVGATHVIVGHSERRTIFGETESVIAKKIGQALKASVVPIWCVGETLAQREAGETTLCLTQQLEDVLSQISFGSQSFIVAYEPVWAIGTGRTASINQIEEVHHLIKELLTRVIVGSSIPVLYGGSVNESNCDELFASSLIDGALVGGASLKQESFNAIIESAERHS